MEADDDQHDPHFNEREAIRVSPTLSILLACLHFSPQLFRRSILL
jgi:hypothetical protein